MIYLVGATARAADRELLEEFAQATHGRARAFNAIGVMARVDLSPQLLERRTDLANKFAAQLEGSLNTVIPVSAGVQRVLDHLVENDQAELKRLIASLRRIPLATLDKLLDSDELFLLERPDCPVDPAERRALLGATPWSVFATIARVAADPVLQPEAVVERLEAIAGFDHLHKVLDHYFLKRSMLLQCFHVVNEARGSLQTIKYRHLPALHKQEQADQARRERFLSFVEQAGGDPVVARELTTFIEQQFAKRVHTEPVLSQVERELARIYHNLQTYNADFGALQVVLDDSRNGSTMFSASEQEELYALLGLHGVETEKRVAGRLCLEHVMARQQVWIHISQWDRAPIRREVAERAVTRYGLILNELLA